MKLPDVDRPLPEHVGACILNKEVIQFSACVGCFSLRLIMHGTNIKPLNNRIFIKTLIGWWHLAKKSLLFLLNIQK
jgi:hypothetical protein